MEEQIDRNLVYQIEKELEKNVKHWYGETSHDIINGISVATLIRAYENEGMELKKLHEIERKSYADFIAYPFIAFHIEYAVNEICERLSQATRYKSN